MQQIPSRRLARFALTAAVGTSVCLLGSTALAQTVPAPATAGAPAAPQAGTPAAPPAGTPVVTPPATATAAPAPGSTEQITVVGTSPLLGSGVSRDLVPEDTQVLGTASIARNGNPDLLNALNTEVSGINLESASGNPYQPSLFYNGFEVSPLQGTSQGVAVYVNGIRFNQPFGDTVNWDLIPDVAISAVNVEGSNPVFGLNALGGSFSVNLKNGFNYQGGEADLSGGSFDTVQGDIQYGVHSGDQALYIAGSVVHQDGWRDLQSTDLQNMYADWGIKHDGSEIHVDLTMANSVINGPGTAPVQLLAVDSAAQFTAPNAIFNRYLQASTRGNFDVNDTLSVQSQVYYDYFQQRVENGNSADDFPCDDGSGLLCQAPGQLSTTRGGLPIPALLGDNPESYSELDVNTTNTNAYGAAGQVTETGDIFGLANHLVAGASFDGAQTEFSATAFIGGITPVTRVYTGPSITIDEPGNNVPVRVAISDANGAGYATDTLNITPALAITAAGRFNFDEVNLQDQGGGDLTGNHAYARFDPSVGATWRVGPWLTAYASYAESNRAPTPAELSCAGPQNSCSLANFFVGDPDLKQVVAHTVEAGIRGRVQLPAEVGFRYDVSLFHTDSDDDIIFINSVTLNRAYFANVGQTRRQGVSARGDFTYGPVTAFLQETYVDATFQSGYVESGGSNPDADVNGNITVRPGDQLPGVPRNVIKGGLDLDITPAWRFGGDAQYQTGQFLFGDEANLTPRLPGYFVLDLHTSYDITPHLQLFASAQNVLDRRYYTFGTFSPTNSVFLSQSPNATNPRAYALAEPLGFFGGVKAQF